MKEEYFLQLHYHVYRRIVMEFSNLIETIIDEAEMHPDDVFTVYHDKNGQWHYIGEQSKQCGQTTGGIEVIKHEDPFAVSYKGKDLVHGSFPNVYDTILCDRLRVEFNDLSCRLSTACADYKNQLALMEFIENNISAMSYTSTDYIAALKQPFSALQEMCLNCLSSISIAYDSDELDDIVELVEASIHNHIPMITSFAKANQSSNNC
jgi:hypothetical protein